MTKYPSQAQLAGLDVQILARDLGLKRLSARLPKRSARLDAKSLLLIPRCFQPAVVLHCTEPECIRGAICSLDQVRMPESDDLHRQASFRRADVVRDAGLVASPGHRATILETRPDCLFRSRISQAAETPRATP